MIKADIILNRIVGVCGLCLVLIVLGCRSDSSFQDKINGGVVYGGKMVASGTERIQTLYPPAITDLNSCNASLQVFEGLVKLSAKDLSIISSLASSWEINEEGTLYTFHLKQGVYFQDDPCFEGGKGRKIVAKDFKYSFQRLCSQTEDNLMFHTTFKDVVKGANEYYESSKSDSSLTDLTGVQVVNDSTLKIELQTPNSSFLYLLAMPATSVFPEEAFLKYGTEMLISTGPFSVMKGQRVNGERLILVKNQNYHGIDSLGNQLPFLDTLEFVFSNSKKGELESFKKGEVDIVVGLPSTSVKDIVEEKLSAFQSVPPKYIIERLPQMRTEYYAFNIGNDKFKDINVRKAFNFAIDRKRIIKNVLNGEAYAPANFGITPPSFVEYDIKKIDGYVYDPEKAKEYLTKAGYANGKDFPEVTLELNSGGYKNTSVAIEVQKQLLRNLGIRMDLEVVPMKQKLEDERYGRSDMFRCGWIADYPGPVSFLKLFHGKGVPITADEPSYPNSSRYVNADFDSWFQRGMKAVELRESYTYLMQAEKTLMEDAAVMVLFYAEMYIITQADIRNLYNNPMNYWDFSQVYRKKRKAPVERAG